MYEFLDGLMRLIQVAVPFTVASWDAGFYQLDREGFINSVAAFAVKES